MEKNFDRNNLEFKGVADQENKIVDLPQHSSIHKKWVFVELVLVLLFMILITSFAPIIILIGWVSLKLRKMNWGDLGFKKPSNFISIMKYSTLIIVLWAFATIFIINPVIALLTGSKADLSLFQDIQGNYLSLVFWLLISWSLAAFGEELMYRGYLQNRIVDLVGDSKFGWVVSILFISGIFGISHLYQGPVGVISVFLTAILFSIIYMKFSRNLWASIFAHGLLDSILFITLFFFGSNLGFW